MTRERTPEVLHKPCLGTGALGGNAAGLGAGCDGCGSTGRVAAPLVARYRDHDRVHGPAWYVEWDADAGWGRRIGGGQRFTWTGERFATEALALFHIRGAA